MILIVAGIKRPMSMPYAIKRERAAGIKRPMSTFYIIQRHFNKLFYEDFIVVVMTGGRMSIIMRPIC